MSDVPSNAPEHCPGTSSEEAGKAAACQGCPNQAACASAPKGPDPDVAAIAARLSSIKHKILVLSGKGGVGKSTFASQLAFALAARGKEVGLLDIDICGPSVPKLLGLEGEEVHQSAAGWSPVYVQDNLGVMSIGFMLPNPDDAVIWRGPRKNGLIKQFLKDVHWGELDYLVVDTPPGTSDEHISIAQLLRSAGGADGAVVVTTPQEVSIIDVRKEISFCRKVGLPVLGVVENMARLDVDLAACSFHAPADAAAAAGIASAAPAGGAGRPQGEVDVTAQVLAALEAALPGLARSLRVGADVFTASGGGAARMCQQLGLTLLGRVPLDPHLGRAAEAGRSVFGAEQEGDAGASAGAPAPQRPLALPPSATALQHIVSQIVTASEAAGAAATANGGGAVAAMQE